MRFGCCSVDECNPTLVNRMGSRPVTMNAMMKVTTMTITKGMTTKIMAMKVNSIHILLEINHTYNVIIITTSEPISNFSPSTQKRVSLSNIHESTCCVLMRPVTFSCCSPRHQLSPLVCEQSFSLVAVMRFALHVCSDLQLPHNYNYPSSKRHQLFASFTATDHYNLCVPCLSVHRLEIVRRMPHTE